MIFTSDVHIWNHWPIGPRVTETIIFMSDAVTIENYRRNASQMKKQTMILTSDAATIYFLANRFAVSHTLFYFYMLFYEFNIQSQSTIAHFTIVTKAVFSNLATWRHYSWPVTSLKRELLYCDVIFIIFGTCKLVQSLYSLMNSNHEYRFPATWFSRRSMKDIHHTIHVFVCQNSIDKKTHLHYISLSWNKNYILPMSRQTGWLTIYNQCQRKAKEVSRSLLNFFSMFLNYI